MKRMVVGIVPPDSISPFKGFLAALEKIFPVSFEGRAAGDFGGLGGLVLLGREAGPVEAAIRNGLPSYVVSTSPGLPVSFHGAATRLGVHPLISGTLRGRVLLGPEDDELAPVAVQPGDEVLASRGEYALWVYRAFATAGMHIVALPPPKMADGQALWDSFNGRRFIGVLPFLHFLKSLTQPVAWEEAPLRACFIFDDPSLRRTTYGYLDYLRLAEHAQTHGYHAAIATIPLQTRWANPSVSAIFRQHQPRLSLLIHGNNHTHRELVQPRPPSENLALLAQALRRVQDFERRHGLGICRVLEPPFGVVSENILPPLGRLGYEAVMIDPEQYLRCNGGTCSALTANLSVTDWPADGLCCIPRIRVASPWWKNEAAFAAFMGVPVVVVGHHYDAKDGLAKLADVAATVNGLGPVRWSNLTEIARANFKVKTDGTTVTVRMGSRRATFTVPAGIRSLIVERPWVDGCAEPLQVLGGTRLSLATRHRSEPIPVKEKAVLEIVSPHPDAIDPRGVPAPAYALWPVARRMLTEFRDRLYPYIRQ